MRKLKAAVGVIGMGVNHSVEHNKVVQFHD